MCVRILGVPFRIPLPLVFTVIFLGVGMRRDVISPLAALLVHEVGHIVAARSMRVRVTGVTAGPFGAAMTVEEGDRSARIAVALGGPAASLTAATVAICAADLLPVLSFTRGFSTYSLVLCAFNLLPAMPLDGGRILNAAMECVISQKYVNLICLICGICACCVLFGVSFAFFPQIHWSILAIALFTLYGCIAEFRNNTASAVTQMLRHERSLADSGVVRLKTIGLCGRMRAEEAAALLRGASFIAVLDDNARLLGILTEGDLLTGMIELGGNAQMIEILRHGRSENIFLRSKS